jgi:hypothetical protein
MFESDRGVSLMYTPAGVSMLTEVSWASSICSDKPIKSTSGLWATHSSFSCCSAFVRCTLSADCKPCSRPARAVCTSAGRTDMLAVSKRWSWGAAPWSCRQSFAGKGLRGWSGRYDMCGLEHVCEGEVDALQKDHG